MYADLTLREFLDQAAARTPVPGGGSVAALEGALATAMGEMVARFGVKPGEPPPAFVASLTHLRAGFTELIDRDAEAYGHVSTAYRLPKGTPEEKESRKAAIGRALEWATATPMDGLRLCCELTEVLRDVVPGMNANVASDFGVSLATLFTAAHGFRLNVEINLGSIGSGAFVDSVRARLRDLEARLEKGAMAIQPHGEARK